MNHVKEVANILGLEIGEKFRIKGHPDMGTFWFMEDNSMGLKDIWDYDGEHELYGMFDNVSELLEQLLTGFYEVEKLPWEPKYDEPYWYFDPKASLAYMTTWDDRLFDLLCREIGNCFKTKEEAETKGKKMVEQLKEEHEKG